MFFLRRLALHRVGLPERRFNNLSFDFVDSVTGTPTNTVLWAENGSGKTSLLRLCFTVLQPEKREYLSHDNRILALHNYIQARDTSHVILEWERVRDGRRERIVTGLIMEWQDLTAQNSDEHLAKFWYSFTAVADTLSFDTLPITCSVQQDGVTKRRYMRLREFIRHLTDIDKISNLNLVVTDRPRNWKEQLSRLGLDPELFRYQVQMNSDEADADAFIKDMATSAGFVEKLQKTTTKPEDARSVHQCLQSYSERISRRPILETEHRFLQAVSGPLGVLIDVLAKRTSARTEAERVQSQAEELWSALRQRESVERRATDDAATRIQVLGTQRAQAEAEFNRGDRNNTALRVWLVDRRLAEAQLERDRTQSLASAANQELKALESVPDVLEERRLLAAIRVLDAQIAAEHAAAEPLRQARELAGRGLLARLALDVAADDVALAQSEHELSELSLRHQLLSSRHTALSEERGGLNENLRQLTVEQDATRQLRLELEHDQLLNTGEATVSAIERVRVDEQVAASAAAELAIEQDAIHKRDAARNARGLELVAQRKDCLNARASAEKELSRLTQRRDVLAADERLRELAATDENIPLPAAGRTLLAELADARDTAHSRSVAVEAVIADHERVIAVIDEDKVAPGSEDVRRGIAVLADAGVNSFSGWRYLGEYQVSESEAAVQRRPDLASGIVLARSSDLGRARDALESLIGDTSSALVVGHGEDLVVPSGGEVIDGRFVIPPHPSLYNREAATAERARREDLLPQLREEHSRLEGSVARDDSLLDTLRAYLDEYPAGTLERLVGIVETADHALAGLDTEGATIEDQQAADNRRIVELHSEAADLQRRMQRYPLIMHRLEDLRSGESRLDAVARQRVEIQTRLERIVAELAETTHDLATIARTERELTSQQTELRMALTGLRKRVTEIEADLGASSDQNTIPVDDRVTLEERFARLGDEYRLAMPRDALIGEREVTVKMATGVAERLHQLDETVFQRSHALANTSEGQDEARLQEARRRALVAIGAANVARDSAVGRIATALSERNQYKEATYSAPSPVPTHLADGERLLIEGILEAQSIQRQVDQLKQQEKTQSDLQHERQRVSDGFRNEARNLCDNYTLLCGQGPKDRAGAPFVGSPEEAGVERGSMLVAMSTTQKHLKSVESSVDSAFGNVHLVAVDGVHDSMGPSNIRTRLREASDTDMFLSRVSGYLEEITVRIRDIAADLAEAAEARSAVVQQLAILVTRARDNLKLAQTMSRLPAGLNAWENQEFIRIEIPEHWHRREVLDERMERYVELVAPSIGSMDAMKLAVGALRAAVNGHFVVTVLKPESTLSPRRIPAEQIAAYSGGEAITTAILLYATFAKMRMRALGDHRPEYAGMLILDNPLGKVSSATFLEVVARVTHALGVQLIFTTHIKDVQSLRTLPNRYRLGRKVAVGGREKHLEIVDHESSDSNTEESQPLAARVLRR
jgi:hypothetical protein